MNLWPQLTATKKVVSQTLYTKPRISITGFYLAKNGAVNDIIHPHHDICIFVNEGELTLRILFPEQNIQLQKDQPIIIQAGTIYSFTASKKSK